MGDEPFDPQYRTYNIVGADSAEAAAKSAAIPPVGAAIPGSGLLVAGKPQVQRLGPEHFRVRVAVRPAPAATEVEDATAYK